MPLPPPANGTFEVVIGGRDGTGNFALNRWVFVADTPPTTITEAFTAAKALIEAFISLRLSFLLDCMGTDCLINVAFAKHIGTLGGSAAYAITNEDGTGSSVSAANVVAVDVAWLPGGTSSRPGHTYLWGVPKTEVQESGISDALLLLIQTFITEMKTALVTGAGTFLFNILTRKTGALTAVTDGNVRPKITGLNKRTKPFI